MTISITTDAVMGGIHVSITPDSLQVFKTLVSRALNTWDFAPPEIKEFGDLIIDGKILQDYRAQAAHLPVSAGLPKET